MASNATVLPLQPATSFLAESTIIEGETEDTSTGNVDCTNSSEMSQSNQGTRNLLDLPIDVLKEIIKEVCLPTPPHLSFTSVFFFFFKLTSNQITHTNDLTALALTSRALHSLVIPNIYSRFDIVWPDVTSPSESKAGVDALTHGLSTLSMHHLIFECQADGTYHSCERRVGNDYAGYTRKFSLGNGPADWVQDYMITKETGKLLSTLVAVSVGRMFNLESFLWDMPTGVSRDVFLALGSLAKRQDVDGCQLERFLIRWHDNTADCNVPSLSNPDDQLSTSMPADWGLAPIGVPFPPDHPEHPLNPSFNSATVLPCSRPVESPTLSALPALKSISVLDIDELLYLDELSILIEESKDILQELRVGISKKAANAPFVMAWDGLGLEQVDHSQSRPSAPTRIGQRRLGGVLGIILGRIFDIRRSVVIKNELSNKDSTKTPQAEVVELKETTDLDVSVLMDADVPTLMQGLSLNPSTSPLNSRQEDAETSEHSLLPLDDDNQGHKEAEESADPTEPVPEVGEVVTAIMSSVITSPANAIPQISITQAVTPIPKAEAVVLESETAVIDDRKLLRGKLRVKTLELERVPLSIYVLQRGIDWSALTSLTILDCAYNEKLWKMLHRHFKPNEVSGSLKSVRTMHYYLGLTHLHTDCATPALMLFLKETLAPNTLEVLFLQDRRKRSASCVGINAILKGPLKRHRKSLRKLLIDSSDKSPTGPAASTESDRWRTWMLNTDVLKFITSGKMSNVQELSASISYTDWVCFP